MHKEGFRRRPVPIVAGGKTGAEESPGSGDDRTAAVDVMDVVGAIATEVAGEVDVLCGAVSVPVEAAVGGEAVREDFEVMEADAVGEGVGEEGANDVIPVGPVGRRTNSSGRTWLQGGLSEHRS